MQLKPVVGKLARSYQLVLLHAHRRKLVLIIQADWSSGKLVLGNDFTFSHSTVFRVAWVETNRPIALLEPAVHTTSLLYKCF